MVDHLSSRIGMECICTRDLFLSIDFYKFYCSTPFSDGVAAHACRPKRLSALFSSWKLAQNEVTHAAFKTDPNG